MPGPVSHVYRVSLWHNGNQKDTRRSHRLGFLETVFWSRPLCPLPGPCLQHRWAGGGSTGVLRPPDDEQMLGMKEGNTEQPGVLRKPVVFQTPLGGPSTRLCMGRKMKATASLTFVTHSQVQFLNDKIPRLTNTYWVSTIVPGAGGMAMNETKFSLHGVYLQESPWSFTSPPITVVMPVYAQDSPTGEKESTSDPLCLPNYSLTSLLHPSFPHSFKHSPHSVTSLPHQHFPGFYPHHPTKMLLRTPQFSPGF